MPETIIENVKSLDVVEAMGARLVQFAETPELVSSDHRRELKVVVNRMMEMEPKDRREFLRQTGANFTPQGADAQLSEIRKWWADNYASIRILCLTRLYDSGPMWDRYSQQGQGALLEFDTSNLSRWGDSNASKEIDYDGPSIYRCNTPEGWAELIFYEAERAIYRIFDDYVFTKTVSWRHENEWRILRWGKDEGKNHVDLEFAPIDLISVTFGLESDGDFEEEVRKLVGRYPRHRVFNLVPSPANRQLTRREIGQGQL